MQLTTMSGPRWRLMETGKSHFHTQLICQPVQGLGTSGAMNVGFISTISNQFQSPLEAAEIAYQFEALLGNKGGRQDQWSSALGGINHLTFTGESVAVKSLKVSAEFSMVRTAHNALQ